MYFSTAEHCVFDAGVWSTNFTFKFSYGKRATTDPAYKFAYDYVRCVDTVDADAETAQGVRHGLDADGTGQPGLVGWYLERADFGPDLAAVGYPAAPSPPWAATR